MLNHFRILVFIVLLWPLAVLAQEPAKLEPITITTDLAATLLTAEIADTPELRERGLMFRHIMPQDRCDALQDRVARRFGQPLLLVGRSDQKSLGYAH